MKLLVLASYAQFGVGAGRIDCRAVAMACDDDPSVVEACIRGMPTHFFS